MRACVYVCPESFIYIPKTILDVAQSIFSLLLSLSLYLRVLVFVEPKVKHISLLLRYVYDIYVIGFSTPISSVPSCLHFHFVQVFFINLFSVGMGNEFCLLSCARLLFLLLFRFSYEGKCFSSYRPKPVFYSHHFGSLSPVSPIILFWYILLFLLLFIKIIGNITSIMLCMWGAVHSSLTKIARHFK